MIKTIAWLAALAVTFLPTGFQQQKPTSQTSPLANKEAASSKWIEFVSKEGAFSALLPSQPEKEDQSSDSPLGRIDIHMFMATNEGAVYLVGYSDIPALATEDKSPVLDEMRKGLLIGTREGLLKTVDGKLLEETDITFNGHPGKALEVGMPGDMLLSGKIYLVKQRVYQLLTVRHKTTGSADSVAKFFASFKLITQ